MTAPKHTAMTAVERASQEAIGRHVRHFGPFDTGPKPYHSGRFGRAHSARLAEPVFTPVKIDEPVRMTLDDINPEHVRDAFAQPDDGAPQFYSHGFDLPPNARKVELLEPEIAAPLASIDQLLEAARVKLRTLPQTLVVHTSHLDEHDREHVRTEYIARKINGEWHGIPRTVPFKSPEFMCANGHALGSGTDWCYRCDEADQDRRRLPLVTDAPDNETRMFDQRERARQTEDDFGPREIHEMMKETHVIVGDHPPERRHR